MKILVTGADGFIGRHLCKALNKQGHDVYELDNSQTNRVIGKININSIHKLHYYPDIVFHLAAQSSVQPSFNNPSKTFDDNVKGTNAVLQWATNRGAKVVYAGSASKHADCYSSPYATSKMIGEDLLKMYRQCFGLEAEIARFYNVYGEGEKENVLAKWRQAIKQNTNPQIIGDGEQTRDFIHVEDIVDGLIKIGGSNLTHVDAFELGGNQTTTINELATMFHERFGCEFDYIDDQEGNVRESRQINQDANEMLNWQPKRTLIDYVMSL